MDGEQWLDGYRHRVSEIERRAERVRAKLDRVAATVISPDGAVCVAVSPAGALQALTLGPGADELSRADLAATILATARRAQDQAAREATETLRPLLGEDSAAMDFLRSQLPGPRSTPEGDPR